LSSLGKFEGGGQVRHGKWHSAAEPQAKRRLTTEVTETTEKDASVVLCELCGLCGAAFLFGIAKARELVLQRGRAATQEKAHHRGHRDHSAAEPQLKIQDSKFKNA
jgi:hypothetical protein